MPDLRGYNHKLAVLAERVLLRMRELTIKEERFELIKEDMTRDYQNFDMEQPYQHAMYAQVGSVPRPLSWPSGATHESQNCV